MRELTTDELKFAEYLDGIYKSVKLTYGSAYNKLLIVRALAERALTEGGKGAQERIVWDDLRTRLNWFCRHLSMGRESFRSSAEGIIQQISRFIGWREYPEIRKIPIRIESPISFTAEPCNICKKSEASFRPNDKKLREETTPYTKQYTRIFEAMIADVFKMMGSTFWLYNKTLELNLTGKTPKGHNWSKPYTYWEMQNESSRNFLFYGRRCFIETEVMTRKMLERKRKSRWKPLEEHTFVKYLTTNEFSFKAEGGLYKLNTELLCKKCKLLVEQNPIQRG